MAPSEVTLADIDTKPPAPIHRVDIVPDARPGRAMIPAHDETLYPQLRDTGLARKVHDEFISAGLDSDVVTVAASHGVCEQTALLWASQGRWLHEKRELVRAASDAEALRLETRRSRERSQALESQIKSSKRLRKQVDRALDQNDEFRPQDLKFLAEALKCMSDVDNRALGMDANGATPAARQEAGDDGKEKAKPLVVVVQGGGIPLVRKDPAEKVIDV